MTQKIKVTAELEIENDMAIDDLTLDTSLGLIGTIKSYDVKYERNTDGSFKLEPKLTYDQVREKYFFKDLNIDTIRTQTISAFMTQESDKFHDFAVEAIDDAALKVNFVEIPEQDQQLVTEILNDEFYSEVLAKKELKDKHGIE